jgi:hypothetical protein
MLDNLQGGKSFKQARHNNFSWLELNNNISFQLRIKAIKN